MSTVTPTPGFLEGVAVAALASLAGGAAQALLWPLLGGAGARGLTLALVGVGYVFYLLRRSPEPAGRVSLLLVAGAATAGTLVLVPGWLLTVQLGLLWLTRSLLLHRGVLAALADLGLVLLGLGAGLWAITATGSLAAALWSFFLVQALFPTLGVLAARLTPGAPATDGDASDQRFDQAECAAAASLRRLAALRDTR